MKHIKKYLTLALSLAFCASFQVFAMEKERSSASGEDIEELPSGMLNTSSEAGISDPLEEARIEKAAQIEKRNKQILTARIKTLESICDDIDEQLEDFEFSPKEYKEIQELKKYAQIILSVADNMLLGLTSVDIKFINIKLEIIHKEYQRIFRK